MITFRFRQTVESSTAGFPFQAGQILTVPRLSREQKDWLKAAWIEVIREDPERALVAKGEQAVTRG